MTIAVIPARGGSKRIPRKNIRDFCGKPMLVRTIQTVSASGLFEHVVVSTDDTEITRLANENGAETPFLRPQNLADDRTPTVPVISHAVSMMHENGLEAEFVCCIYPCNPFLQAQDLLAAFKLLQEQKADFVYPVTEYAHPVQRAMRRLADGRMEFLNSEHELTRTQDFEPLYHDAGQFYWGTASAWLAQKRMHTDGIGMTIPSWRVVDIDSEDDWRRAELLFETISAQATEQKN